MFKLQSGRQPITNNEHNTQLTSFIRNLFLARFIIQKWPRFHPVQFFSWNCNSINFI